VDVRHLLRDTINVVRETFPKNIRLEDDVPVNLAPIMADPTQVHQVILNLCVNARDAMPAAARCGSWRRTARSTRLPPQRSRGLRRKLAGPAHRGHRHRDTRRDAHRIWEPFFTTKEAGAARPGLSTVRGIVESHKGFINLKTIEGSEPPSGLFSGDRCPRAAGQRSFHEHKTTRGNGELVMIVDDEPHIRDVTAAILTATATGCHRRRRIEPSPSSHRAATRSRWW